MFDPILGIISCGYLLLLVDKSLKVFVKPKGKSKTTSQYVIAFIMIMSFGLLSASYFSDSIHYKTYNVENIGKYGHLGLFTYHILKLANGPFYLGNLLDVLGHYLFFFRFMLKNTPFVNASGSIFLFISFLIPSIRNLHDIYSIKYISNVILCLGYLFVMIHTIQHSDKNISSKHKIYNFK